jgi:hypothetical protein
VLVLTRLAGVRVPVLDERRDGRAVSTPVLATVVRVLERHVQRHAPHERGGRQPDGGEQSDGETAHGHEGRILTVAAALVKPDGIVGGAIDRRLEREGRAAAVRAPRMRRWDAVELE